MPHPFFDRPSYPWEREDAKALHRALTRTISKPPEIEQVLANGGVVGLQPGTANAMWKAGLDLLSSEGKLRRFGDTLPSDKYPVPRDAFTKIEELKDPLQQCRLSVNTLFVNRTTLRAQVESLAGVGCGPRAGAAVSSDRGGGVLLVRGEKGSGKSHTSFLINEHASAMDEGFVPISPGLTADIETAVSLLFDTFGATAPPRSGTDNAWLKLCCGKLASQGEKAKKRCWIVADDLGVDEHGAPKCDPLLIQFVDQAVYTSMMNAQFARWFRLVLIDYPDVPKRSEWRCDPPENRTSLSDFSEDAVRDAILSIAADHGLEIAKSDAQLRAAVVLTSADRSNGARGIDDALRAELKRLGLA